MDNLGTEVGQKMRCAVKAKLMEIGTGSTGYLDDELPDYVMIMVANKRSKKQMRDDLQLFLNDNTDAFVNWLHQVLDKLQEVTLPSSVTQKVSSKSSHSDGKKESKKGKKQKRSSQKDQSPAASRTPQASITDVFADQLIGKAKKSLEIESHAPVKKQDGGRKEVSVVGTDFNIPSVSEMVKEVVMTKKKKELEELEAIQKQIDEAKRQLKIIPGGDEENGQNRRSTEGAEDEDDDFLNLKADDEEDDVDNDSQNAKGSSSGDTDTQNKMSRRTRSPIVFDRSRTTTRSSSGRGGGIDNENHRETETKSKSKASSSSAKDRLGPPAKSDNIISLSAHRMMERELYTPVHRRGAENPSKGGLVTSTSVSSVTENRIRDRSSEFRDRRRSSSSSNNNEARNRHQPHRRSPQRRERSPRERRARERPLTQPRPSRGPMEVVRIVEQQPSQTPPPPAVVIQIPEKRLSVRQRIGSRVIVAPPKPQFEEEEVDVPVNSVVTVKPRPAVPKNRQANKNLLLRAMAEAQKSMVSTLTKQLEQPTLRIAGESIKSRLGGIKRAHPQPQLAAKAIAAAVKRQKKEKIIIEIGPNDASSDDNFEGIEDDEDEQEIVNALSAIEYVPKPVEIPRKETKEVIEAEGKAEDEEEVGHGGEMLVEVANTQFVVTLDGAFKKATPIGVRQRLEAVEKRRAVVEDNAKVAKVEIVERPRVSSRREGGGGVHERMDRGIGKEQQQQAPPPKQLADLRHRVEEKRNKSPANSNPVPVTAVVTTTISRKRKSPINFRETPKEKQSQETVTEIPIRKRIRITNSPSDDHTSEGEANGDGEGKLESAVKGPGKEKEKEKRDPKKYDNIPPLLSSVAVAAAGSTIGKVLERCKYFPNCSRGDSSCEFVHPSTNCKTFPNCKFGETCLYLHPKCKFDLACIRLDCNYSHTPVSSSAAPLASHVVPVQNYKSISSNPLPALCRFYPNCANSQCNYFHPKMCYFGKSCTNKLECNFYHHDLAAPTGKFKWVSPMTG